MAKIVCVLYEDPVTGYPRTYARDDIPNIERYPGGQTTPTPKSIDFRPGQLLGSVSGELGLRKFLESQGHTLVVTTDKDGPNSVFEKELVEAAVVISQPFWPAYLTAERKAMPPEDRRRRCDSRPRKAPANRLDRRAEHRLWRGRTRRTS
jgi:formate dehydrogenase